MAYKVSRLNRYDRIYSKLSTISKNLSDKDILLRASSDRFISIFRVSLQSEETSLIGLAGLENNLVLRADMLVAERVSRVSSVPSGRIAGGIRKPLPISIRSE